MLVTSEQNDPHQILLSKILHDHFKLIYAYLNKGDEMRYLLK